MLWLIKETMISYALPIYRIRLCVCDWLNSLDSRPFNIIMQLIITMELYKAFSNCLIIVVRLIALCHLATASPFSNKHKVIHKLPSHSSIFNFIFRQLYLYTHCFRTNVSKLLYLPGRCEMFSDSCDKCMCGGEFMYRGQKLVKRNCFCFVF